MKLIDLLVQELPKHGGWPEGAVECCRFVDEANIDFYDASGNWPIDCGEQYGAIALKAVRKKTIPCECEKVTREQYEAALAASQTQWNGEGLPPVGCEFEHSFHANDFSTWHWRKCTATGKHGVLCVDENDTELYLNDISNRFRPIRSESDKKRDEAIQSMASVIDYRNGCSANPLAGWLYDAISAGKIPHIQLK